MSYSELGYGGKNDLGAYFKKVFLWMAMGLIVTAGIAYVVYETRWYIDFLIATQGYGHLILIVAQLGLVVGLGTRIQKASFSSLLLMFLVYSALTGVTFSTLIAIYDMGSIGISFACTALLFVNMGIIGYTTKADLSKFSTLVVAGLITLILVTFINMIIGSDTITMILNYAGVLLFMGITAYDTQKVKRIYEAYEGNEEMLAKFSIYCSLQLYLDFVNMFIYILRIVGKRK